MPDFLFLLPKLSSFCISCIEGGDFCATSPESSVLILSKAAVLSGKTPASSKTSKTAQTTQTPKTSASSKTGSILILLINFNIASAIFIIVSVCTPGVATLANFNLG